jgi:hypothetical protein
MPLQIRNIDHACGACVELQYSAYILELIDKVWLNYRFYTNIKNNLQAFLKGLRLMK